MRIIDRAVRYRRIRKIIGGGKILTNVKRIFEVCLICSQNNAELLLTRNERPAIFEQDTSFTDEIRHLSPSHLKYQLNKQEKE